MDIGKEMLRRRKLFGISRKTLSDMAEVSPTFIQNIEEGKTETINKLNTLITILEKMEQILIKEDKLPTLFASLDKSGFSFEGKPQIVLLKNAAIDYYSQYLKTAKRYFEEYNEQFALYNIFKNQNKDPRIIAHDIAVNYTLRLMNIIIVYLQNKAEKEGVDVEEIKFNEMYLSEWNEGLCEELHDYMENNFTAYRPSGEISDDMRKKLEEYL